VLIVNPKLRLRWRLVVVLSLAGALFPFTLREKKQPPLAALETSAALAAAFPEGICSDRAPQGPALDFDTRASIEGELPPVRFVIDPYPTFNGLALDDQHNRVVMSDENRKSVLVYDRSAGTAGAEVTSPMRRVMGPLSEIGFIAGIGLDPGHGEMYAVNNDLDDRIVVFDYDSNGDLKPKRRLYVPHQAWGISLNRLAAQFAITVQQLNMIAFYRREAAGLEAPLRIIEGPNTGLADPHGLDWDVSHHEIVVANHGNYSVIASYSSYDAGTSSGALSRGGHFLPPSITVYQDSVKGDAEPLRKIEGKRTMLNWPMGIDVDPVHDEIAVANNGDNSVLIFRRSAQGDTEPVRVLRGPHTEIDSPVGIAVDAQNDEIWVANYGDHTAAVFSRSANGDIAPKRIIRNAPPGTPTGGFGNPYAVAYDSKRDQLLVPN
jgi:DNA-binding beta-propeller fold protein YncE